MNAKPLAFLVVVSGGIFGGKAYAALGDPLPGLTTAQRTLFNDGKEEFSKLECVSDGLGPVFTGPIPPLACPTEPGPGMACATCHDRDAIGGGTTLGITETRYGSVIDGIFDPLGQWGGTLRKHNGIGEVRGIVGHPECDGYVFPAENVPDVANVTAQRRTTPLFGATYLDHVADDEIRALAAFEAIAFPETAGRVAMVQNPLTGRMVVGKFGWKLMVDSLDTFSGDAYVNEMGITNFIFPNENCSALQGCNIACNPNPNTPNDQPDPVTGRSDTNKFQDFMRFLESYPQSLRAPDLGGLELFARTGCANCHTPALVTGSNRDIPALDRKTIWAFTDELLHNMGESSDGIVQGAANRFEMRTAPLMGLNTQKVDGAFFLWHDGQSNSIEAAIARHAGQGRQAAINFAALSDGNRTALVNFLNSI